MLGSPYTLIASGDIKDFAGLTVWPRYTKTTTPMQFTNTVAYQHYQLMFPTIRTTSDNMMQIAEIELLVDVLKATAPNPADGAVITMPLFQWAKGDNAVAHNVYFGTSPDLTEANLVASGISVPVFFNTLTPIEAGSTYCWRVDEIDAAGNVYTGDVWSVLAAPKKAYAPSPKDGDKWIPVATTLTWIEGVGASSHKVYLGTDEAAVAARDASVSKGTVGIPLFKPDVLLEQTTYFWAIDEVIANVTYAGPVWSFTTEGGTGGIRGDYFVGTTPKGVPAVSRIESTVDFAWGAGTPDALLADNNWSARWTADLEIAVADTYTFSVNSEGCTRLWIDGQLVINQWVSWVPTTYSSLPMKMEKGFHSLRLEFADKDRDAQQVLSWETPTMASVVIPSGPLQPPVRAQVVYPANGATNVAQTVILSWNAGEMAVEHDVYFGVDKDAVANATPDSADIYMGRQGLGETTFDPGTLEWNKTYFWRVDEVNEAAADSPWKASVWSFTTADFIVVDDMEIYTAAEGNRIYQIWPDGYEDTTNGSQVGYTDEPFVENGIVHGGRQSMPFSYDNTQSLFKSTATREFATAQDWTVNGMTDLVLFVRGIPTNTVQPTDTLFVTVEDEAGKTASASYADTSALLVSIWTPVTFPLSSFAGVDVTQVKKMSLGVGSLTAPAAGGAGQIYIDDIGVVKP